MYLAYWVMGIVPATFWIVLGVQAAFGMRKLARLSDAEWDLALETPATLTVVVPARNEAEDIEQCLRSLLGQDYSALTVIAVDDRSTDATGALMDHLAAEDARLRAVHVRELPSGWLGKTHAMWMGAQQTASEYILFTDGDVIFAPSALRRAMAFVERERPAHLAGLPRAEMHSWGERMMLSFFQIIFMLFFRMWKAPDPKSKAHVGIGAFNLIRRDAYERIGTFAALRMEILEDLNLGRLVKEHGYRQQVAVMGDLVSLHWAAGAIGIVHNLSKNSFATLKFNLVAAAVIPLLTLWFHIAPYAVVWVAPGWSKLPYALTMAAIFGMYWMSSRATGVRPYYFLLHPVAAVLMGYALMRSVVLAVAQGGVTWRGTKYSLAELRSFQHRN